MEDGMELDSEKVETAIKKKGLTFEGLEKLTTAVPVEGYNIKATGTG